MSRRRDRAWIVCVGTRLYLVRGTDEAHALDDVRIRLAGVADLQLVDMTGGERQELERWTKAVHAQTTAPA